MTCFVKILYEWLHSRVVVDWGWAMNNNWVVRVGTNAGLVIGAREDGKSSGRIWANAGELAMWEKGYKK